MERQLIVMTKRPPLKKGLAKIQYVACENRIKELQKQGCDIFRIYTSLVDEGLITMSYAGFYENHTQRRKKVTKKPFEVKIPATGEAVKPAQHSAAGQSMSTMPKDKILSLDEIMQKNLKKSQAFTESQGLPDGNPEDREAQLNKHIGN